MAHFPRIVDRSTEFIHVHFVHVHCTFGGCPYPPSLRLRPVAEAPDWRSEHRCHYSSTGPGAPMRTPSSLRAHSVHALNIPAQLGISYLSRCQSFSWSIHHAFCDLEYAVFLSKWFQLLAESQQEEAPLSGISPPHFLHVTSEIYVLTSTADRTRALRAPLDNAGGA